MSIRHANLWVQTHHHFDHSTRQNKTRFQRIFAHVNWVGRCCEICLSRHPLYHWPIDAAWKNVSEIFSIWGLCRCNSHFDLRLLRTTAACIFSTSQLPKVLRTWSILCIWTSKCASCHNSVHLINISASKSASDLNHWSLLYILTSKCASQAPTSQPTFVPFSTSRPPRRFVHFGFEMCFAPQCRALSQHLNSRKCSEPTVFFPFSSPRFNIPKCSEHAVLLAFWLGIYLRATTACKFWSHLPRWLRTRRFSECTFRPFGQNRVFRDFFFHAPASPFFWLFLFFLLPFSSLTLPTSTLPSAHVVGSLTSKLPSISTCPCITPAGHVTLLQQRALPS